MVKIVSPENGPTAAPNLKKGAFGKPVKENNLTAPIAAPLLSAQGLSDNIVQSYATDVYVQERCAAGQSLDYWVVPGGTHQSVVFPGSPLDPEIFNWTRERFAGRSQAKGCHARALMGK